MTKKGAKRLRVEVVDAFHGLVYGKTSGGFDGRLGFYRGEDEEDVCLEVEDCCVTAIPVEARVVGQVVANNTTAEGRLEQDDAVIVPEEYDVGDVAVGEETRQYVSHVEDFEYPMSMTQGPSQEDVVIQNVLEQKQHSIFTTGSGKELNVQLTRDSMDAARRLLSDIDSPRPPAGPNMMTSVFTTGSGSAISVPKEKLDAAAKFLDTVDDSKPIEKSKVATSIFTTGAGSAISISKEKMDAAARFLVEDGDAPCKESDSKTPTMSRFVPRDSKSRVNQVGRTSSVQTPGNALLAKRRHRSSSGLQTPRLVTPQNAAIQKMITPGSNMSEPTPSTTAARKLPVTPELASKYCFDDSYGPGDVRAHLLLMEANPAIVVDAWVRNHYKWIVWKLALVDVHNMTHVMDNPVSALHYDAVKDAVYHRYQKEYVKGKKSFLKGVLQRDIPSALPCVLKVASIQKLQTPSLRRIELTDGWYSIFCDCDEALSNLVSRHQIYIGKKLRISHAELVGGSPGEPLEAVKSSRFVLGYNQVHPASYWAKLGFQRTGIPITPLSHINERGGKTPRTVVTILRVFPPLMWSKLLSGVSTFQTQGVASRAVAALDAELEQISIKSKELVQQEELEMCRNWLKDGDEVVNKVEKMYATFVVSQSQGESFVESLDEHDKLALHHYISERMVELNHIQQKRCKEMLAQEFPAALSAKSTPCQTVLVGEVSQHPFEPSIPMEYFDRERYSKVALLMVWNPSTQFSGAKEGDILSITAVDTFTRDIVSQRYRGEFLGSLKQLQTTPLSEITMISRSVVSPDRVVQSLDSCERSMTVQRLLQSNSQKTRIPQLLHVTGLVVRAGPVYLAPDLSHHYQWAFLIDASQDIAQNPVWMMAIHLSGPQDAIKWFDTHTTNVVCHFQNVSVTCFDNTNNIIAMEGGMATSISTEKQSNSPLQTIAEKTDFLENLRERLDTIMSA